MDLGWNTVQATGTRKCKCRYCTAGCFHGSRGLASAYQRQPLLNNSTTERQPLLNNSATERQPLPYMQTKKKVSVSVRKNRGLQTDRAPRFDPDWAKRQADRIRAWHKAEKMRARRQAEKIRAWRQVEKIRAWSQALKKEAGQAVSVEQTESRTNEGTGPAPSGVQDEATASEDTGLTPSGDQPEAMPAEQPNQALNHDPGETHHSPLGCQMPDNAGDVHLSSSRVPGESESGNTTEVRAELFTGTEPEHLELVPPIEKKTVRMKRVLCIPTNKTWALEQAARIKAWREAKNREVTLAPSSVSANVTTVDVENLPLIEAP